VDLNNYQWLVFDFDDTIVPGELHDLAWERALKFTNLSLENFLSTYNQVVYSYDDQAHGSFSSKPKLLKTLLRLKVDQAENISEKLLKRFRANYRSLIRNYVTADPHNTFESLKSLSEKYNLAIISNNSLDTKFEILKIFSKSDNSDLFTEFIVSEEVGYRKPAIEIFNYLLERINQNPDKIVFIGDNVQSDSGALNANIDFIHLFGLKNNKTDGNSYDQIEYVRDFVKLNN
jgi:HAD superfamily hydrolase (TIGR01549 family)